jgi:TRAP-type C4-dicarboxylate transport system substrate-binding protein
MKGRVILGILGGFILLGFLLSPCSAQEKVITLNYAHFMPIMTKQALLAKDWCTEVEKRTNGRVKINFFPGSTLLGPPQMYDGVVKGIADVGWSFLSYTRGRFPLFEVVDLPLGYKTGYTASKMANELYRKFKPKELDDAKLMYLFAHGPGLMVTNRPVYKLEDLKGMKIRSTGLSAKIVQALGGAPVGMPIAEAYDALMKGVTEGIVVPVEGLQQWKLAEVTKYVTESYGAAYTTCGFAIMNKNKWNSLPPDIQKIIDQINEEWLEKTARLWDSMDVEGKKFSEAKGIKFIPLSKEENARWVGKVKPLMDDYVKDMKAKNLPGDAALKFAVDYLKAHDK